MKKAPIILILIALILIGCAAQPSKVISFNMRYNSPRDNDNSWSNRKQEVIDFIKNENPDFLGLQEDLIKELRLLDSVLTKHRFIGIGSKDGISKGEHAAIFYNATKFDLIEHKTFWLSETPDKVSAGWDAIPKRICTYGAFLSKKSKETLHIFNTHFDNRGRKSKEKAAELIVNKIREFGLLENKIIVMGDLNSHPKSTSIRILSTILSDGASITKKPLAGPKGTFSAFSKGRAPTWRIDYILTKNIEVLKYEHMNNKRSNGLWLSDHLPILIEIK